MPGMFIDVRVDEKLVDDAELAAKLADARIELVPGAWLYSPYDRPGEVSEAISRFASRATRAEGLAS